MLARLSGLHCRTSHLLFKDILPKYVIGEKITPIYSNMLAESEYIYRARELKSVLFVALYRKSSGEKLYSFIVAYLFLIVDILNYSFRKELHPAGPWCLDLLEAADEIG